MSEKYQMLTVYGICCKVFITVYIIFLLALGYRADLSYSQSHAEGPQL